MAKLFAEQFSIEPMGQIVFYNNYFQRFGHASGVGKVKQI